MWTLDILNKLIKTVSINLVSIIKVHLKSYFTCSYTESGKFAGENCCEPSTVFKLVVDFMFHVVILQLHIPKAN